MSAARKIKPDQNPVAPVAAAETTQILRAQKRMTAIMIAVVAVLGFAISIDMLRPPSGMELSQKSGVQLRGPASIAQNGDPDQAVELHTDCNPSSEVVIPAFVNQIRLIGSICSRKNTFEGSEIYNVTNGYAATVFYPTPTNFTTDYISLSSDENLIHITHFVKKAGREVRELRIRRQ